MKKIAFYGGTFDPVHCGHITVAEGLLDVFPLDEFYFLPAYHAPHKPNAKPTSGYHRFAMLSLATAHDTRLRVSTIELDHGERRYTVDTLSELDRAYPDDEIFFVMGADSWTDIKTWREWERVLLMSNHIVVTRPGFSIDSAHVTEVVKERLVDVRGKRRVELAAGPRIYFTDVAQVDVSATGIREDIGDDAVLDRRGDVPNEVAKYIEKYELYR